MSAEAPVHGPMPRPAVTVFTSAVRTRFLESSLRSLLSQAWQDWEWVVVVDHESAWWPSVEDPRIRIVVEEGVKTEGSAKRLACYIALGECLVALEPGDALAPEALEAIVMALDTAPEAGLAYSGYALVPDGDRLEEAVGDRGHRRTAPVVSPLVHSGLEAVPSFEPLPHNIVSARHAPAHVLAFRHSAYDAAGGYDESLEDEADHDLVCRVFEHADATRVDTCLYVKRRDPECATRGAESSARPDGDAPVYDRHIESSCLAWARRRGLRALNFGSAYENPAGYTVVDRAEGVGVDIVADLSRGLDLPDSSVGVVRAVDYLVYFEDKVAVFNELYRVLAHGGMLLSLTPSTDGRGAFQDPSHVAYYNENSFWYFTEPDQARYVPAIDCRFQVSKLATFFPSDWHREHHVSYVAANLVAIKDAPQRTESLDA